MKKTLLIFILVYNSLLLAQVPEAFNYRAVVFSKDSVPLVSSDIRVDVKILDDYVIDNAKTLYEESHWLITNKKGGYYLKIGNGEPGKKFENLSDVLWKEDGEKFINIKIYDEDNKLISNGTSQLMSVPYALVAKEVLNNSINNSYNSINDLKNESDLTPNNLVYLKGFHHPYDGGGGFFVFNTEKGNSLDVYEGMIVKPGETGSYPNGRWVRVNHDYISVKYLGARGAGDVSINDTQAIQKAIDYAHTIQPLGGLVFFPKGTYYTDLITLKDKVSLKGVGATSVIMPYSNIGDTPLVKLDTTMVTYINVSDLLFDGAGKNRTCLSLNSLDATTETSGIWFSTFKNLKILRFKKTGIYLIGTKKNDTVLKRPNQFLIFENIRVEKMKNLKSFALRLSGQVAQTTFINRSFSGHKSDGMVGTNVLIASSGNNSGGSPFPRTSLIKFITCTFENAEIGIVVRGGYSINISDNWFENLQKSLIIKDWSRGVDISNNRFSNAGSKFILSTNNAGVIFERNVIIQSDFNVDTHINISNDSVYFGNFNYYETPGGSNQLYFN